MNDIELEYNYPDEVEDILRQIQAEEKREERRLRWL